MIFLAIPIYAGITLGISVAAWLIHWRVKRRFTKILAWALTPFPFVVTLAIIYLLSFCC